MSKVDILDNSTAIGMKKLVGLRNLLMHRYWIADDSRIYRETKGKGLRIIKKFVKIGTLRMFREDNAFKISPEEREKMIAILKNFLELKEEVLLAIVFGGFLENRKIHDIDVGVNLDSSKFKD